jgi:hypothetical protein
VDLDLDARAPASSGVLDQLLDGAGRPLDHLAGGDAVDDLRRQAADGHGKPATEFDKFKPALAGFVIANSRGGDGVSITVGKFTDRFRDLAKSKEVAKPTRRVKKLDDYDLIGMVKSLADAPAAAAGAVPGRRPQARPRTARATVRETAEQWARGPGARGRLGRARLSAVPGLHALDRPRAARRPRRRGQGHRLGPEASPARRWR